jgi:Zn-dependent metalloprotease
MKRFVLFITFCILTLLPTVYAVSSSAEKVITEFLQKHKLTDLRFQVRTNSDLGSHFVYQHYLGSLPVEGSGVAIHLNQSNEIVSVSNSFQPQLTNFTGSIHSAAAAHSSAIRFLGKKAKTSAGELVILPMAGKAVPAWKLQVDSGNLTHGSLLLYIDAIRPNVILRVLKTHTALTGEGNVYLENPVVSPERSKQPFLYLHGEKLNGKFLKTFNANDKHDVNEFRFSDFTTASNPNSKYNFRESDLRLAEAMAYFHINRVHDRWKQFGMTVLDAKAPVFVNVTEEDGGKGLDNAFYSRVQQFANTGVYVFGSGEELENLGLDADVYYHEYGHGVLDQSRPQFLESFESNYPRAFHEAFGDISAAAITGNSKIGEFGLRIKETQRFVGRELENNNRFPQDVIHPEIKRAEIHHAGLIVGGAWWDLQKSIGVDTAQQILFEALPLLPKEMTFFDLRDSLLVTDSVLNQGRNQQAIESSFMEHGIAGDDPGQPGTLNVTALRTGIFDFETGNIRLTQNFQQGDTIAVLADYQAQRVIPGYNMIPETVSLQGPPSNQFLVVMLADEVVQGRHGGVNGALQLLILTDVPESGTYKIHLRSRLGGTKRLGPARTVSFTIN